MESLPLTTAALHEFVAHIDRSLDALRTEMRAGFARVDTRLQQVDTRLTHVETRLDQMDMRLNQMDMRLNQMDGRFVQLDSRLGRLEARGLHTPLLLAWLTAGVALVVSLLALWR